MRLCKHCKKNFIFKRKDKIYCSRLCKSRFWNAKKPRISNKSYFLAKENRLKELNYQTKQVVYGSLLGDGCLVKNTAGYRFSIGQCERFKEYLEWKKSLTNNIFQQLKPSCHHYKKRQNINSTPHYFYHSICHPFFAEIYLLLYPNGKKVVIKNILDKIDRLGLAIWYQDDGTRNKWQTMFCTNCFDFEQHKVIQKWFMDKWKIKTYIMNVKGHLTPFGKMSKDSFMIRMNKADTIKFTNLIKCFIQPCMSHKLPK